MKNIKLSMFGLLLLLSGGILLSSCSKKDNNDDVSVIPSAGLLAFNLAPDQAAVSVELSGNRLTAQPLAYSNYNGYYQRIYTGTRDVKSYDFYTGKMLASNSYDFKGNQSYSLFVVGLDSNYSNIIAVDDVDSSMVDSGHAFVRYINAITDTTDDPTVKVSLGDNSVSNEKVKYGTVSAFTAVSPGDLMVEVNNSSLDIDRTISVEAGRVYTVLLIGVPGDSGALSRPQIKYIENGVLVTDSQ